MHLSLMDIFFQGRKLFFISDTHFFHKNIIEYSNRPFVSITEMNQEMIEMWNAVVGHDDIVIHGGDLAFGGYDGFSKALDALNGTIILLRGNHEPERISFALRGDCFDFYTEKQKMDKSDTYKYKSGKHYIFADYASTTEYTFAVPPWNMCKAIVLDTLYLKGLGIGGQAVTITHTPQLTWYDMNKKVKSCHIHGHCHGNLPSAVLNPNRFDLSCDNIYRMWPKMGKRAYAPIERGDLVKTFRKYQESFGA